MDSPVNPHSSTHGRPGAVISDAPLALSVGTAGLELSSDEVAFFRDANPFGLFLFRRNIDNPDQVRRLCAQFREAVGRADAPVFIDQEGGRVQRLDNGRWPSFRSLGSFGTLARKDLGLAKRAIRLSTQAMGSILAELTIDSATTPVVDLAREGTHDVIGQRALGDDPELVVTMAREVIDGMLEVGALPIMKHIPGYGRVTVDPHFDCPTVDAKLDDLRETDFQPFIALKDTPWAMVAHLIFTEIDPQRPASVSPLVCDLIRNEIGYDGVLITDCLSMEALKGTPGERVAAALAAGYDVALLSQGGLTASEAAARAARPLNQKTLERIARAEHKRGNLRADVASLHAEVERIFKENGLA
jgi:beta-N-acetylhexosaminidase